MDWEELRAWAPTVIAALALVVSIVTLRTSAVRDRRAHEREDRIRRQEIVALALRWSRDAVTVGHSRLDVETTFSELLAAVLSSGHENAREMLEALRNIDDVAFLAARSQAAHEQLAGLVISKVRDAVTAWATDPAALRQVIDETGDAWFGRMHLLADDADDPEGGTTIEV